jgi:hypothetical protein
MIDYKEALRLLKGARIVGSGRRHYVANIRSNLYLTRHPTMKRVISVNGGWAEMHPDGTVKFLTSISGQPDLVEHFGLRAHYFGRDNYAIAKANECPRWNDTASWQGLPRYKPGMTYNQRTGEIRHAGVGKSKATKNVERAKRWAKQLRLYDKGWKVRAAMGVIEKTLIEVRAEVYQTANPIVATAANYRCKSWRTDNITDRDVAKVISTLDYSTAGLTALLRHRIDGLFYSRTDDSWLNYVAGWRADNLRDYAGMFRRIYPSHRDAIQRFKGIYPR